MIINDRRLICFVSSVLIVFWSIYYFFYFSKDFPSFSTSERSFPVSDAIKSNPFICPILGDKWIIVTTIFYPSPSIHKFLQLKSPWNLIVIGDRKTPHDWLAHVKGNRSRLLYLSIEDQSSLDYSILQYIPQGSYARKNIGYLVAIQCGGKLIFESDDDNLLETDDVYYLPKIVQPKHVPWIGFHGERSPLINIYASFGHPNIWPRGFPIDELRNVTEDGWHSVRRNLEENMPVYIQQYLADLDPDVDALVSR